jgi:cell division protein FtsQ
MTPPTDLDEPPASPAVVDAGPKAPMDPRFRARRIEVRRDEGRRRLQRLVALGVLAGVVVVLVGLAFTPVADVDRIVVEGTFRTSPDVVADAGGIHRGDPTVLVDTGAAAAAVAALPWVDEVEVERSFPGTVRYVVQEREPLAVATTADGRLAVLDGHGQVVEVLDGDPSAVDLPLLEGVVGPTEPGEAVGDDADLLVRAARELPGGLAPVVASVRAADDGVELALVPTGVAHLGGADDLEGAYVALATVLSAVTPACVGTIDVAVPASPVLTGVPGCQ